MELLHVAFLTPRILRWLQYLWEITGHLTQRSPWGRILYVIYHLHRLRPKVQLYSFPPSTWMYTESFLHQNFVPISSLSPPILTPTLSNPL